MRPDYISFKFDQLQSDQQKLDNLNGFNKAFKKIFQVTEDLISPVNHLLFPIEYRPAIPAITDYVKTSVVYTGRANHDYYKNNDKYSVQCSNVYCEYIHRNYREFQSEKPNVLNYHTRPEAIYIGGGSYSIPWKENKAQPIYFDFINDVNNNVYSPKEGAILFFGLDDYTHRQSLLENLDFFQESLINNDHLILRNLGKSIETDLVDYESTLNDSYIKMAMVKVCEFREFAKEAIKISYTTRAFYIKKIVGRIGRDIRQSFRSIVWFIFKNMDDNSGDHDKLLRAFSQHFSWIFNLNYDVKKRNHPVPG